MREELRRKYRKTKDEVDSHLDDILATKIAATEKQISRISQLIATGDAVSVYVINVQICCANVTIIRKKSQAGKFSFAYLT